MGIKHAFVSAKADGADATLVRASAWNDDHYPLHKYDATVAPTVNDDSGDNYGVGSIWVDVTANKAYTCVDATVGAAIWSQGGGAGGVTVEDEGSPLATVADTLNFVGSGVTASGTGTTKTITIPASGVADILDLPTVETDDTLVLAPNGTGGVGFRAEAGGGGMTDLMTSAGDIIYEAGGTDWALGCSVSADSTRSGAPANVVDGNVTTLWQSNRKSPGTAWLTIDLGATARSVASFRVLTGLLADYERFKGYKIQSSPDSTNWADRFTQTGDWAPDSGVISIAATTARYWRFINTEQTDWEPKLYTFALFAAVSPASLGIGAPPQVLGIIADLPAWVQQTVRSAAGVPSGAPTGTELPVAIDTTGTTGGLYVWTGAAWVKGSTIP